jgi:hypothetical protein
MPAAHALVANACRKAYRQTVKPSFAASRMSASSNGFQFALAELCMNLCTFESLLPFSGDANALC